MKNKRGVVRNQSPTPKSQLIFGEKARKGVAEPEKTREALQKPKKAAGRKKDGRARASCPAGSNGKKDRVWEKIKFNPSTRKYNEQPSMRQPE